MHTLRFQTFCNSTKYFNVYSILFEHYRKVNSFYVTKGSDFSVNITKQETELTPEMIVR